MVNVIIIAGIVILVVVAAKFMHKDMHDKD